MSKYAFFHADCHLLFCYRFWLLERNWLSFMNLRSNGQKLLRCSVVLT